MAQYKQSQAYTRMFLLVQSSDHVTGLTAASPTVNISKAGGSFAGAGGTVTEVASGFYKIALTTTDTNTLGELAFHITATSGDPTDFVDQIVAFDPTAPSWLTTVGAKKNTALANFMFLMTDSTNHAPKIGLVNSDFTKKESIDGASGASLSNSISEVDSTNLPGIYKISLTASELNGNVIALRFSATGCDDTDITLVTSA